MKSAIAPPAVLMILALCLAGSSAAAQLKPETIAAFDAYIRVKEGMATRSLADRQFLRIDGEPSADKTQSYNELQSGRILIERDDACAVAKCTEAPGGLIHDWTGIVFVPSVSLVQVLTQLQDYDRDSSYYQPEVVRSKLVGRAGDDFQVFLRLKRVEVITVVFDTKYDVHYSYLDPEHAASRSYSTSIEEVENAGTSSERDRPAGDDRGFLWRLYSYWRFYQADGGVYIQCNAVSLTRDIPTGLGWMVRPFLEKIPEESLRFTLGATRTALAQNGAAPTQAARSEKPLS